MLTIVFALVKAELFFDILRIAFDKILEMNAKWAETVQMGPDVSSREYIAHLNTEHKELPLLTVYGSLVSCHVIFCFLLVSELVS